ncbi:hypothetical protein OHT61_16820 [Streptomyces sp. NBC_00178]|uniref:hypothetical protein n=1 Tax=Streptomyces sp. NBC_00178 TaxID=2975672 RepID=UPI002E29D2D8|nr:hypothetical protein [Streptomyces sp. NBC_00178]
MSLDLAVNLAASLIAFVTGWLARNALMYYRGSRPVARLWRIDARKPVTAVVGRVNGGKTLWEADALAAMNIRLSLARELKIHSIGTVSSASFRMAAHAEDNVVVIGGPAMNEVWETYASRLDVPYDFRIVEDRYRIVAREGDVSYGETRNAEVKQDHALVILAPNPFEPGSRVVMLAGCGYLATLAAPVVFSPDFARTLNRRFDTSKPLALILSVEDVRGYMPRPEIVAGKQFAQSTRRGTGSLR